jgi:hypothetical protein
VDDVNYVEELPFGRANDWEVFTQPIWAKHIKVLMRGSINKTNVT